MMEHNVNGTNWHSVSVFFQNDKQVYLIAEVPVTKYDKLEAETTVLAVMGMHPS